MRAPGQEKCQRHRGHSSIGKHNRVTAFASASRTRATMTFRGPLDTHMIVSSDPPQSSGYVTGGAREEGLGVSELSKQIWSIGPGRMAPTTHAEDGSRFGIVCWKPFLVHLGSYFQNIKGD